MTTARGIRLPESLWQRIDSDAAALRMRPNEFVRRLIEGVLLRDLDVQNTPDDEPIKHMDDLRAVEMVP